MKAVPELGIELATSGSGVRRAIECAVQSGSFVYKLSYMYLELFIVLLFADV